ncbi:MAG: hypothetical protein JRJ12_13060 [Deltaproteobacteria bacterium]|nr:hypothetical protein [Deltaproteobacteria bacterium]MBW2072131.1 hypothetical protein [Deltaproteobacteria bacterium]
MASPVAKQAAYQVQKSPEGASSTERIELAALSLYNEQQMEAFVMVRHYMAALSAAEETRLRRRIRNYLRFRKAVRTFQEEHLADLCQQKCFVSHTSACCGREGIITFFADVVLNVLVSTEKEIDALLAALQSDRGGPNCVYLTSAGCLWRLKPVICEMFLCEEARRHLAQGNGELARWWARLKRQEKYYTWPTRPVLFDMLESLFIEAGYESPLMYFHQSPGLLRLKSRRSSKAAKQSAVR